jgi:oxygen-independent coproporphyrinogen-3 oxidase
MAGIYIHIPYCRKACHYCNFHFSVSLKTTNDFIPALLKEIELQQNYLANSAIETIYFGGGTPSLLEPAALERMLHAVHRTNRVLPAAEITLEANPDDITEARLRAWKEIGINRLSIGVQSFFEEDLRWMNRAHSAQQAVQCIRMAQTAGFGNITIDLIYGSPGLSNERWLQNLRTAIDLGIPHLSCYALTVEPGTALKKLIAVNKKADVDPEKQAEQFLMLIDTLGAAGYQHYEISNFALPGRESKHNSAYWKGSHYLGLGPSAHSYNGSSRQWNVANNALYIAALSKGELSFERETLTEMQQLNEYIMTALRTSEGINIHWVDEKFGPQSRTHIEQQSKPFIKDGKLHLSDNSLVLTRTGKLFADGIAAALFV